MYTKRIIKNFSTSKYGFGSLFIGYLLSFIGKLTNDINLLFIGSLYLAICWFITIYVIEDYKNNTLK